MATFTTYVSTDFSLPGYFYNVTPSQVISANANEIVLAAPGGDIQFYQGRFSYYSNGNLSWYGSTLTGLVEYNPAWVEVGRVTGINIPGSTYYSYSSTNNFSGLKSYAFSGNDRMLGSDFNDIIYGYTGNDWISGNAGNDVLRGDSGNDYLDGGLGLDILAGGFDDDILSGGVGADVLYGESGNDFLSGDRGFDFLDGGFGNDTLQGGLGADTLTGGAGNDFFRFTSTANIDLVTDYAPGTDQIQLSASVFTVFANQIGQTVGLSQYIGYNQNTGALVYDVDGAAGLPGVQFATIGMGVHPSLTNDHFLIIA